MTGGSGDSGALDSTELYDSVAGTWTTAGAKLPSPSHGLRATNINNKVLIFGINISFVIQRYNQVDYNCRGLCWWLS